MNYIFGFLFLVLFMPLHLWAFQNEPKEFRGIKWGSSADIQKDLILYGKDGDLAVYKRKGEKLIIGEADKGLKNFLYYYYKNRFFKVVINTWNGEDSDDLGDKLTEIFKSIYGKPSIDDVEKGRIRVYPERGFKYYATGKLSNNKSWRGSTVNIDLINILFGTYESVQLPEGCEFLTVEVSGMTTSLCIVYTYKPIATEYERYKKEQAKLKESQEKLRKQQIEQEQKKIQKEKAEKVKKDL